MVSPPGSVVLRVPPGSARLGTAVLGEQEPVRDGAKLAEAAPVGGVPAAAAATAAAVRLHVPDGGAAVPGAALAAAAEPDRIPDPPVFHAAAERLPAASVGAVLLPEHVSPGEVVPVSACDQVGLLRGRDCRGGAPLRGRGSAEAGPSSGAAEVRGEDQRVLPVDAEPKEGPHGDPSDQYTGAGGEIANADAVTAEERGAVPQIPVPERVSVRALLDHGPEDSRGGGPR